MVHPDEGSVESWTAEGSADKMRADFVGWEPRCVRVPPNLSTPCRRVVFSFYHRIQKLLALIPSTLNWKLMDRAPLSTWVHRDGKLALLGDSCHPMLVRSLPSSRHIYLTFYLFI